MKGTIISSYQAQSESLLMYLKKVKDNYSMEDIHQLRVCIKNLRVLLSITEIASKGRFSKKCHFRLFSGVFKSAGKVRRVQIYMGLSETDDFKVKKRYQKYLAKCEKRNIQELKKQLSNVKPRKLSKLNREFLSKARKIPDRRFRKTINCYIKSKLESIHQIKDHLDHNRSLHYVRIELKRLEEVLKVVRKHGESGVSRSRWKSIKNLRIKIGEWHDLVEFCDSLEVFYERKKQKHSKGGTRKFIKCLKKEENRLKKNIIYKINSF